MTIEKRWRGIEEAIETGWEDGLVITGLCCSKKTGEYLLVMTESTEHQWYQWDLNYSDNIDESYHPTVVLDDPKCHRGVLTVMTTQKLSRLCNFDQIQVHLDPILEPRRCEAGGNQRRMLLQ